MQPFPGAGQPGGVVSGEGVVYDLPRAGLGSRIVATLIDCAAQVALMIILILLDGLVFAHGLDQDSGTAIAIVEAVAVLFGYPLIMEWSTRGRTLGKLALGLRVVRDDGGPIAFRQATARAFASLILEKPGLGGPVTALLGCGVMTFSNPTKRLGDMMAGTFVLNERAGSPRRLDPMAAAQFGVPWPLQQWAATADLSRLDDQLALAVRQFLLRVHDMHPSAQAGLGEQLRQEVEACIAPPVPPGTPTPWLLHAMLGERRRRADLAAGYGMAGSPSHQTANDGRHGWTSAQTLPPAGGEPPTGGFTLPG